MERSKALPLADGFVAALKPYCAQIAGRPAIEKVGSLRRGCPDVHDIDIVAIPSCQGFYSALDKLGNVSGGPKIYKVEMFWSWRQGHRLAGQGFHRRHLHRERVHLWATLLLIRTGSANHNKMLCTLAKSKGMKLHADGSGLEKLGGVSDLFDQAIATRGGLIPCDSETEIFKTLGLPYKSPQERN